MDFVNIIDSFSATGVLLVFVIMLFSLKYPIIMADINRDGPRKDKTRECERERKRLMNSFIINCIPQTVILGITAYLFLPLTVHITKNSQFSFWEFDFVITMFVFVVIWIWIFFIWSLILGIKLFLKASSGNLESQN